MGRVIEHISGPILRRGNSGATANYVYKADGYATTGDAANAVAFGDGAGWPGLPASVIDDGKTLVLSNHDCEPDNEADDIFVSRVVFTEKKAKESEDQPDTNDSEYSFAITGNTTRVNCGFEHHSFSPDKDDPDVVDRYGGAINVRDKRPEGVDIVTPGAVYSETHWLPTGMITPAWFKTAGALVGRTNQAAFRGFGAREMLLTGISGQKRGSEDYQVTFDWATGEHRTDLEIAGATMVEKEAHDYLWVDYSPSNVGGKIGIVAQAIYVHRVYEPGDYAGLGIGS